MVGYLTVDCFACRGLAASGVPQSGRSSRFWLIIDIDLIKVLKLLVVHVEIYMASLYQGTIDVLYLLKYILYCVVEYILSQVRKLKGSTYATYDLSLLDACSRVDSRKVRVKSVITPVVHV